MKIKKENWNRLAKVAVLLLLAMAVISYIEHREKPKPISAKHKKLFTVHEVKKGDSIEKIAKQYEILPWQLRQVNGFESKDSLIHPKQRITIPKITWKTYRGRASWYGPGFHGKKMANGQIYNQNKVLVAHRTLPLGMWVEITNLKNGKKIIAQILDRGPYTKKDGKYHREIDLSFAAAKKLGATQDGIIPVKIKPIPKRI